MWKPVNGKVFCDGATTLRRRIQRGTNRTCGCTPRDRPLPFKFDGKGKVALHTAIAHPMLPRSGTQDSNHARSCVGLGGTTQTNHTITQQENCNKYMPPGVKDEHRRPLVSCGINGFPMARRSSPFVNHRWLVVCLPSLGLLFQCRLGFRTMGWRKTGVPNMPLFWTLPFEPSALQFCDIMNEQSG